MTDQKTEPAPFKGKLKKSRLGKSMGILVEEPGCPVCDELGFSENMLEITGLEEVANNPQAKKGAPRVVDCSAGCRYGLEPYYNPKSNGSFVVGESDQPSKLYSFLEGSAGSTT